uniref:Translation initiation factor IF2/IF5 domain-containing protein n=1 Tax=viral metagenome TaxID=1070528 RepID=A0A6C0JA64_9ZZZZ
MTRTTANNINMINVNGDESDPYYRYKMPRINTTFINQKKGLTDWTNASIIATAIYKTPEQIKKYMCKKLGTKASISKMGGIIFSGKLDTDTLQDILQTYINKNVMCKKCNSPETVEERCQSCGNKQ